MKINTRPIDEIVEQNVSVIVKYKKNLAKTYSII